jgi:hypothetical protein
MAFSGAKSAIHSSFKSEHLRAIVTRHGGDSHGEAGGPANRLGERKLELRRRVGASRFCLHLCWNSPLAGHTVRGCVLTALLFGTAFLFWTYYPHDLPLPTLVKGYNPARPDNPVTTNYLPPATMQR